MFVSFLAPVLLASLVAAKVADNWLDRMVAIHKKSFLEDFARLPPITVSVKKAPAGFVDSPKWDKEAVFRLIMLVEVLDAKPVKQAIRSALGPSRRFYLPYGKNTFELFPSWGKHHPNNFYYDDMVRYDEPLTNAPQDDVVTDDTVVYISNPVEAHLPASMVTVRLLRELMEQRSIGLRQMPPSTRVTHNWVTKARSSPARAATDSKAADTSATTLPPASKDTTPVPANKETTPTFGTTSETADTSSTTPPPTSTDPLETTTKTK